MGHVERFVKGLKSSVFLSHNKKDSTAASNIAIFLTAENINVWFDEWEIAAGDSIIDEIEKGLKNCTHFLIIWSKNASKSNWVREELKSILMDAIKKGTPKVIPILLDDTELPPFLKDRHHIVYHGGTEKDREEIVESIIGNKPSTNFVRAIVKKYHEIVYREPQGGEPFGIKYCPKCGSDKLKGDSPIDYYHDEQYYTLTCTDCGWTEVTQ